MKYAGCTQNRRNKEAGFSVIEAIIALVVLSIFVVAMSRGVMGGLLMNQKSRNMRIATDLIEAKFDEMRKIGFTGLNHTFFPSPFEVRHPENPDIVIGEGRIAFSDRTEAGVAGQLREARITVRIGYTREPAVSVSATSFFAPE